MAVRNVCAPLCTCSAPPFLTQVGALAVSGQREDENPHDGELTFLGRVLAQLPVSQQLGKLIVLGHVFGCLDECLIIGEPRGRVRARHGAGRSRRLPSSVSPRLFFLS